MGLKRVLVRRFEGMCEGMASIERVFAGGRRLVESYPGCSSIWGLGVGEKGRCGGR